MTIQNFTKCQNDFQWENINGSSSDKICDMLSPDQQSICTTSQAGNAYVHSYNLPSLLPTFVPTEEELPFPFTFFPPLPNTLPKGKTTLLANPSAHHTLTANLTGRNNLIIAYDVATSRINLLAPLPPPIFCISPSPCSSVVVLSSSKILAPSSSPSIHPFLLKYLVNFPTPSSTHSPFAK